MPSSLRVFLYVTALITGGVVLVVEILGAKMLTPWFGSSHFVWTAQITITLLALAAGYYLGGWLADRTDRIAVIYAGLAIAAAYLAFAVRIRSGLAAQCLEFNLAIGSILASLALFLVPLTLLAAVGPFFVRRLTSSVDNVGRAVGRLSSLGTVGSVLGVLVTSYLLVPYCRDSTGMLATAGVLAAVSLVYFIGWGLGERGQGAAVGAVGAGILMTIAALRAEATGPTQQFVELARANSHFGNLQVAESRNGRARYYFNDRLMQNSYDPERRASLSMFTYGLYHLSKGYTPELRRALCLGMGIGITPTRLAADGIKVDVVEINAAVVPLAERWFDFPRSAVNLVIDDARHFLRISTNLYDTIHLDAFLGDSSPSHLMTREAFSEIRARLNPGGTLVINSFAHFEPGRDFLGASLHRTLSAVFRGVRIHQSPGGNVFYVASDRDPMSFRAPANLEDVHPYCRADVAATIAKPAEVDVSRGLLLTDDYNPVDYHDAGNREKTRRMLATSIGGDGL